MLGKRFVLGVAVVIVAALAVVLRDVGSDSSGPVTRQSSTPTSKPITDVLAEHEAYPPSAGWPRYATAVPNPTLRSMSTAGLAEAFRLGRAIECGCLVTTELVREYDENDAPFLRHHLTESDISRIPESGPVLLAVFQYHEDAGISTAKPFRAVLFDRDTRGRLSVDGPSLLSVVDEFPTPVP